MIDVSPVIPAGRQVIERYGGGGFRISGVRYEGSVLVRPDATKAWSAPDWASVTAAPLVELGDDASEPTVLLIGTGAEQFFSSKAFRAELRAAGLVVETMNPGAACRTFNVLTAEGRRVAAALIATA